ncbi:hypothetical protein L1887_54939 [Cichorium endivia]|nr:hypothetical protein L1887_54939 [Cichorium endivia]
MRGVTRICSLRLLPSAHADDARLSALWISTALDNVEGQNVYFRSGSLGDAHSRPSGRPKGCGRWSIRCAAPCTSCSVSRQWLQPGWCALSQPPFAPTLRPYTAGTSIMRSNSEPLMSLEERAEASPSMHARVDVISPARLAPHHRLRLRPL